MVKGGSSYLSQSELPVTFGLEKRDHIERVVIDWPSGRTEEYQESCGRPLLRVHGRKRNRSAGWLLSRGSTDAPA